MHVHELGHRLDTLKLNGSAIHADQNPFTVTCVSLRDGFSQFSNTGFSFFYYIGTLFLSGKTDANSFSHICRTFSASNAVSYTHLTLPTT